MKSIISILIEKESGALVRIVSLINRRRFNIESITIGSSERNSLARLTIVVLNDSDNKDKAFQLTKQLRKLINVLEVKDITSIPNLQKELILIKLKISYTERDEILALSKIFKFKIVDVTEQTIMLEFSSNPEKILALEKLLEKYEIIESVKTGKIALIRESRIDDESFSNSDTIMDNSNKDDELPLSLSISPLISNQVSNNQKSMSKKKRAEKYSKLLEEHHQKNPLRPRQFEKKRYAYLWR